MAAGEKVDGEVLVCPLFEQLVGSEGRGGATRGTCNFPFAVTWGLRAKERTRNADNWMISI